MIRKLKLLGVLAGVVVISAVSASAAQATFTSAKYPATVTGTSSTTVLDVFPAYPGVTFHCNNTTFQGTLTAASTTLTVTPWHSQCLGMGLLVSINNGGCDFLFHKEAGKEGTFSIACSQAESAIEIMVIYQNKAICHWRIPAQTGKGGYTLTNNANGTVSMKGSITELTLTQVRTSILCPPETHTSSATYTFQTEAGMTFSGNNGAISAD